MRVADVTVTFEERYWYPDDGGIVWLAGYSVVDPSGRPLARDAPELLRAGLRVVSVAGAARFHDAVLQSDGAAPGSALRLRREPDNEHDACAIAIDVDGGEQLGWVPRGVAAELAPLLDGGERWSATVLREWRASPRDPRDGVTALLAAADEIVLRERPQRRR